MKKANSGFSKATKTGNDGFQKVGGGDAVKLEKGIVVEGYLVGHKVVPAKKKGEKPSILYKLKSETGELIEVWGGGAINHHLLNDGIANPKRLSPVYVNRFIRMRGLGKKKIDGRKEKMNDIELLVHDTKKLK